MKVKTSDLTGAPLAWAVAKILQLKIEIHETVIFYDGELFFPDIYWDQGGPIIEQQGIAIKNNGDDWSAKVGAWVWMSGPTPLIAAMRGFVAANLGDEIDLPVDLAFDCLIYETGDE